MRINLRLCLCALALFVSTPAAASEGVYKFPDIPPRLSVEAGYRLVGVEGSAGAAEYEYLRDSVPLWWQIVAFPFPHRIYLEIDSINKNDYFTDLRYAYGDIVLSRWLNRTLFHNRENPALRSSDISIRDASSDYGVTSGNNDFFLRLKTPNFPFHVYLNAHVLNRDGTIQQRFLGGSSPTRVSSRRQIDWSSRSVTVGANSHMGPVEVDYSHTEKRFESGGERVLSDVYQAAVNPRAGGALIRAGGVYPHNLVPDTKGSADTFKIHTSYTGRLTGAATFSRTGRENEESGAQAEYSTGAGELRWAPSPKLAFNFKYRHKRMEAEIPESLDDAYYGLSTAPTPLAGIKPPISLVENLLSGGMRLRTGIKNRVLRALTLSAEYSHRQTERENSELWDVPAETTDDTLAVAAEAKLPLSLQAKLRYRHRQTDNPAYASLPDTSDSGSLLLKWTPAKRLTASLSYGLTLDEREKLPIDGAKDRESQRRKFAGNMSLALSKDIIFAAGYAYINNRAEQDLKFSSYAPAISKDVLYEDTTHNYSASLNYAPKNGLNLGVEALHTASEGDFSPGLRAIPSKLNLDETVYAFTGRKDFKCGWGVGVRHKYSELNSDSSDVPSGTVNITMLTLSRKW